MTVFFQVVGVLLAMSGIGFGVYVAIARLFEQFNADEDVAAMVGIVVGMVFAVAFLAAIVSSGEANPDRCGIGTVMAEESTWNGRQYVIERVCVVEGARS